MREGRQEPLHLEISVDESSTEDESSEASSSEVTTSGSDSLVEVMGVTLSQPPPREGNVEDSQLESMLSKDLTQEEKGAYVEVLHHHSTMFISNYEHITGVTNIQHHIHLNEGAKPVH